jgi:pimeloyl-ACP methyl ester carboxylesterase
VIPTLPPGLSGDTLLLEPPGVGRVIGYRAGPESGLPPVLLIHSVNAAACAREVRPVYEHAARTRPTYALDLPGFGLSDRSRRDYTPRLMTDAVLAMVGEIRRRHGPGPIDGLALSLGTEFLARAATEDPDAFRTLTLVSPTGFKGTRRWTGAPGTTRAFPGVHRVLANRLWGRGLFDLLTRPPVIRFFLEKTWGGKAIDEDLWAYDVLTTQQPGAEHAPLYFLSAHLFSADVTTLHEQLSRPVWMCHGVRGDFVDYRGAEAMKGRANWRIDVFPTGALPHFEAPAAFFAAYDALLA